MSWLAGLEDSPEDSDSPEEDSPEESPVDHDDDDARKGWTATLPSVYPPCLDRQKPMLVTMRNPISQGQTRKIMACARLPLHPDWYSFWGWRGITEQNWQPTKFPFLSGPIRTNERSGLGLTESQFFGDKRSPLELVIRNGRTQARFTTAAIVHSGMPTARHFAQWGRKAEYQRGGGIHRLPLRRTPRWSDDWRTERKMRDTSARLDMYRWGVVNCDPDQLPDIAAKVAHRCGDGTTREIQVEKMCATAYENYRQVRLAFATNHGKMGFWRTERLEGNERGTAHGNNGCGWGGKAPQIVAGNYKHGLGVRTDQVRRRRAEIDPVAYDNWLREIA